MKRKTTTFLILAAVAMVAVCVAFRCTRYVPATLVLVTTTMEKGDRQVQVRDMDSGATKSVGFTIGDDTGVSSIYSVELPAIRLSAINIPPLAGSGRFQISRVTLQNDTIRYTWDSDGVCREKGRQGGIVRQEICKGGGPVLTVNGDQSLTITSIPATGSSRSPGSRITAAVFIGFGILFSGLCLLWPLDRSLQQVRAPEYLPRLAWALLAAVFLYQFYAVAFYAVDVPYWEEWEYFKPDALPRGFSWQWLWEFSGLHRVVFTKLLTWLNFKLLGLDFAAQKVFNYLLFALLLPVLFKLKQAATGRGNFTLFPLFMLFLLSPIAYENHIFAYQSQIHLALLFSLAGLYYAFHHKRELFSTCLCAVLLLCAIYSFSAGVVLAAVVVMGKTLFVMAEVKRGEVPLRPALLQSAVIWAIAGSGMILWSHGYTKPAHLPPDIYPSDPRFWDCFLNLLSFGFGMETEHMIPGVLCLLLVLAPCLLLMGRETRWQRSTWMVMTAIVGILAALAAISVGRGTLEGASKTSRYVEIGFLLIPLASVAWWMALRNSLWRRTALCLLWLGCAASFADDWSTGVYLDMKQAELESLDCVEQYVRGAGDGKCPTYPDPIGPNIDLARRLGIHFTRAME